MASVVLSLGSNKGNKEDYLRKARKYLQEIGEITKYSSLYLTEPWGFKDPGQFLNQVIVINSGLSPIEMLREIKSLERLLGRKYHGNGYEARVIDVDIIFFDELVIQNQELIIPHPKMHLRNFVLYPLMEIMPDYLHPVFHKTIKELYKQSGDLLEIRKTKLPGF